MLVSRYNSICLSKYIGAGKEWNVYYDIVESGKRIRSLREKLDMTRQELAERIGLSVQALKKIELGMNGTKIDTLVEFAYFFHTSLDYLVCGEQRDSHIGLDELCQELNEKEQKFVRKMVESTIENIVLFK